MENRKINPLWSGCRVEKELEIRKVFSMFLMKCPEKYFFAGELHDSWELFYLKKGRASVTADERVYTLDEGCIIIHKPFEFHKFETTEKDSEFFVTSFTMEGALSPRLNNCSYKLNTLDKEHLEEIISQWEIIWANRDGIPNLKSHKVVMEIFSDTVLSSILFKKLEIFLLSLLNYKDDNHHLLKEQNGIYKQLVTLLEERRFCDVSIKEMADEVGVSEATVRNVFHRTAGCGAHKYLLKIKIREAINLIRQGKTISETSDMLGFNNPNYFSVVFKRETGKNPSEYK